MTCNLKFLILFFLFLLPEILPAQSISAIRKEKEKSEKEIAYLNKLLNEAKSNKSVSIGKLNILRQKIVQSKRLINSLNQEMNYLENSISLNELQIEKLQMERTSMLDLYSKLIYGTWKRRSKTDKLMFIFSASDFNQAYNRFKYFEQIQDYSKKQLFLIKQINDSLDIKNDNLKKLIDLKTLTLNDINAKNKELESEQASESLYVKELQKKEKEISKKIQEEVVRRKKLIDELNKLIASQVKKSTTSTASYKLTPEEKLISDDFAKNKGKLPWPVTEGFISEKFGVTQDPIHKYIKVENQGINITTSKNASIRSVFQGVVVKIIFNFDFNNAVIIRHGDYFTVYSNLISVNVQMGQTVKTKDIIGKIAYKNDEGSILNFQILKIYERLNPELWLVK